MHDADTRITIGALARLTGLPVRTLRFYSDSGLVAPARTPPPSTRRFACCEAHERAAAAVTALAGAALAGGIEPSSVQARPVVDELAAEFARLHERDDGPEFRTWLAGTIDTFADRRAERYWELLAIINGWPQRPSSVPAWEWLAVALRV